MNENPNGINLPEPAPSTFSVLGWLARSVPNLIVLAALVALGYWGHHTGWKLPKYADLTGKGGDAKGDWCEEHSAVHESQCVLCNPNLLPPRKSFGWCEDHGVFDCPWEHPEVGQLWSTPAVTTADSERARELAKGSRVSNSTKCAHHGRPIQFASDAAVTRAGVKTEPAYRGTVTESVTANGEIGYDPNRVASLAAPVSGRVWRVYKKFNDPAAADEVLALVNSSEVTRAKTEFKSALAQTVQCAKQVDRLKPLADKAVPGAELIAAEGALGQAQIRLADAQQALVNLGLPVKWQALWSKTPDEVADQMQLLGLDAVPDLNKIDRKTAPEGLIPVKATRSGIVVERRAVEGDLADPSKTLFVVADTSVMTLTLNVRQEDAKRIHARDAVRFRTEGAENEIDGKVATVSTAVDEKTRTVRVRAELDNHDGQLLASTFGTGRVILRKAEGVVLVPSEAVQWEGDAFVVFVRDRNYQRPGALKVFHTRVVRPGARDGGMTEIIAGVLPGESVVSVGSGVLRSELLKNDLGEG